MTTALSMLRTGASRIPTPTRPVAVATVALLAWGSTVGGTTAASTEEVYADGRTSIINTSAATHLEAPAAMIAQADPIYIIGFPVAPGTSGSITLPSGYEPQHNGLPPSPVPYHDHVVGNLDNPLRRVVQVRYTWDHAYSPSFEPITSVQELEAAAAAGHLEVMAPGSANPYQRWTNTVFVRPVIVR